MNYGMHPGWIEVISGVMFGGKSEELIRRVRRGIIARRRVQVFKSHLDSRYTGLYSVSSHDGTEFEATPVDSAAEIFRLVRPDSEIVAIDEAQFLDLDIVSVATLLAGRGVRVILAGTDTDFRGEPFGAMGELMAVAEMVDKLQAICVRLRRSRVPQPAADRRQAGEIGLADDHDRRAGELRGAVPALSPCAEADEDQKALL